MRVPPKQLPNSPANPLESPSKLAIPIQCSAQHIVGLDRLLPFRFLLEQDGRKAMSDNVEFLPALVPGGISRKTKLIF
jgi:hypothetical protein